VDADDVARSRRPGGVTSWEGSADAVPRVLGAGITLAHGRSFAICSETGDIGGGVQGLYVGDTRIGAYLEIMVDGDSVEPLAWHSDEPFHAEFVGRVSSPHLLVFRDHWVGSGLRTDLRVRNPDRTQRRVTVRVRVGTDLADVFDVKDRRATGDAVPASTIADGFSLGDASGDHAAVVRASPPASLATPGTFAWDLVLAPRDEWSACLEWSAVHRSSELVPDYRCGDTPAHEPPSAELASWRAQRPTLRTDVPGLADTFLRSIDDLGALRIVDPAHRSEPVVAAGAPWFMTLFGRDALLTAWMALLLDPSLALTTLTTLARLQGRATVPERDEQPGRILHEVRFNSAASLALDDADIYYGSADATPLFVMLVHELWSWGTPFEALRPLLPAVDAALDWCAGPGDPDGDGYVEYRRSTPAGLRNQGWKDSHDAIHFADGELAEPPIALSEVQAYTYAAWRGGAALARAAGDAPTAARRDSRAVALKRAFNRDFFMPERQAFAVALDADKRPVSSVTSNMGHCLWAGIIEATHAPPIERWLRGPELASGWGLRTLATSMARYDPLSYHNGSVWPHDTAIAIAGLRRAGFTDAAVELSRALLQACRASSGRPPELFSGLPPSDMAVPVPYPASCSPQAWASAAPLLVVRALLGLEPALDAGHLALDPVLPSGATYLELDGMELGGDQVTIAVHGDNVSVDGLSRSVSVTSERESRADRDTQHRNDPEN
jgi:glycogen debranching enzyme